MNSLIEIIYGRKPQVINKGVKKNRSMREIIYGEKPQIIDKGFIAGNITIYQANFIENLSSYHETEKEELSDDDIKDDINIDKTSYTRHKKDNDEINIDGLLTITLDKVIIVFVIVIIAIALVYVIKR